MLTSTASYTERLREKRSQSSSNTPTPQASSSTSSTPNPPTPSPTSSKEAAILEASLLLQTLDDPTATMSYATWTSKAFRIAQTLQSLNLPKEALQLCELSVELAQTNVDQIVMRTDDDGKGSEYELRNAQSLLSSSLEQFSEHLKCVGRHTESLDAVQKAVDILTDLYEVKPEVYRQKFATATYSLAAAFRGVDDNAKCEETVRRAIVLFEELHRNPSRSDAETPSQAPSQYSLVRIALLHHTLAHALLSLGKPKPAIDAAQESARLFTALAEADPSLYRINHVKSYLDLGLAFVQDGQFSTAVDECNSAIRLFKEIPVEIQQKNAIDLHNTVHFVSSRLVRNGLLAEAMELCHFAVKTLESLPEDKLHEIRHTLTDAYSMLATRYIQGGQEHKALLVLQKNISLLQRLSREQPDKYELQLAKCLNCLSLRESNVGKQAASLDTSKKTVRLLVQMYKKNPDATRSQLAIGLTNLVLFSQDAGDVDGALEAAHKSSLVHEQLVARDKSDEMKADYASTLYIYAKLLRKKGKALESVGVVNKSVSLYEDVAASNGDVYTTSLAKALQGQIDILVDAEQYRKALDSSKWAVTLFKNCGYGVDSKEIQQETEMIRWLEQKIR